MFDKPSQTFDPVINFGSTPTEYTENDYIQWISINSSLPYWNLPLKSIIIGDKEILVGGMKMAGISLADPFLRLPLGHPWLLL